MKLKLTPKRQQILDILKQDSEALSAKEIHARLPEVDLVTIYRNLDTFVQADLIKKLPLVGVEALYEYQSQPHHHAVCRDCDKVLHFDLANDQLKKLLKLKNFDIEDVEVVVRGTCRH